MTEILLFVAAKLSVVAIGSMACVIRPLKDWSIPARLGAYFGVGSVLLTLHMQLLALLAIRWTLITVLIPLIVLAIVANIAVYRSRQRNAPSPSDRIATIITTLACVHLTLMLITTQATSSDYLYFWGAKAVKWAHFAGMGGRYLADPWVMHLHAPYPPLVSANFAWDIIVAGQFYWRAELLTTVLWLAATAVVLRALLTTQIGFISAGAVTACWSVILALSLAASYSGGNAEAPLVFFATVAVAALISGRAYLPLAVVSLAGLVLTKIEGTVLWLMIVALGFVFLSDTRKKIPAIALVVIPAAAIGLWWLYELVHGIPFSDPTREQAFNMTFSHITAIPGAMLRYSAAGTWGLSWLVPILVLVIARPKKASVWFPIAVAVLLSAFYVVYYLHARGDPGPWISYTWPRVSQPALSLLILAAGIAAFSTSRRAGTLPAAAELD